MCKMEKSFLFFIYMTTRILVTAIQPFVNDSCGREAIDIVFAVDSSASIWKPDFDRQLVFIKKVTEQFDIGNGPKQTKIGVVSFASHYYLNFHLWQNNRPDLLTAALQRVRHRRSQRTNTGSALHYIHRYMFTHRYGSRKNAAHVVVVITDGNSQDRKRTVHAADVMKSKGIHVFAIGVGSSVDHRELQAIASKPSADHVLTVDNYQSLDPSLFVLANKTCNEVSMTTPRPPPQPLTTPTPPRRDDNRETYRDFDRVVTGPTRPPPNLADIDPRLNVTNCGGKPADIYFALDASNSIWPEDFKKQLAFVRDLIQLFDISTGKTRVGLVTFSDNVRVIFDFHTKQEINHLSALMSNISFMSGRTQTSVALRFIREQGFSRDVARREVAHIVLLFTDGLSKNPRNTAREAELAKRDGIYLFSIGIGMSVERTELRDIASDPDDDFVFHVSNFSVLNTIKDILAIKTCAVMPKNFVADEKQIECNVNTTTDLMFVYDSAQLGMEKTRRITKFVYDVTSALNTYGGRLKVGRLLENCLSGADTYLNGQLESMDFDQIHFPDLRNLIRKVARVGFSPEYGARRNAKKVAVLFLDDGMENLKQAAAEIERLRDTHTLVITIGNTDLRTAASFSSEPVNDYLVHIPSYKYLLTAKSTLLHKLCKVLGL